MLFKLSISLQSLRQWGLNLHWDSPGTTIINNNVPRPLPFYIALSKLPLCLCLVSINATGKVRPKRSEGKRDEKRKLCVCSSAVSRIIFIPFLNSEYRHWCLSRLSLFLVTLASASSFYYLYYLALLVFCIYFCPLRACVFPPASVKRKMELHFLKQLASHAVKLQSLLDVLLPLSLATSGFPCNYCYYFLELN